ncbi:MAG: class I SAM-dependent methyltransferase [Myxococcales bacterium]|nr:class I SAM-dependent methyltransferase [Myxococcales bacterium]
MSKTGDSEQLGTAEGAVMSRALHALHGEAPILNDTWAVHLLSAEDQRIARAGPKKDGYEPPETNRLAPIFAVGVGSLRYAEDAVESALRDFDIRQYVCLGAGFDTFALRRGDLLDRLSVFEVDHPDVQRLKRERIDQAPEQPQQLPEFVPADFERTNLSEALSKTSFSRTKKSIFSWMNTIPYLTLEATNATLAEISALSSAGSRLVLNYPCEVPRSAAQIELMTHLRSIVDSKLEGFRSSWKPETFTALLAANGFHIVDHATEDDLGKLYFQRRRDGFWPGMPTRLITAETV